ncbi:glutamyl-tRNA reductase [Halanaeroarchaeum sulfurireducens]|uniref:Glutamyl-tRNA reductase n=1 Tax=Halanaeroarchaeum sulfurireducens TaxID=1604004 RepID=A0A0F7PFL0_9EURY|nr:glutamyl-tRNA reductase [Halanaeroarchaeum sulfurireducens]AKH98319.1 glutamyl-tRNA reductase [Halanaeroarchaeum sulfurireducens]ALG82713.1 glutamyl-tRNA reductase [Halanaeroarchaeum sulfurireducens]
MNRHATLVTGARVSHEDANVCDLEAVRRETERDLLAELRTQSAVREAFALQTCHRVEAYVVTASAESGRAALGDAGFGPEEAHVMDHEESIRHLMRVAAGLESVIVGEDQIIGQVRDAYDNATTAGTLGPILDEAILKAIRVGERARTETSINDGVVSLGSAAVRLADTEHGLSGATATVVGIGEMGTLSTVSLDSSDVGELYVANRTPDRAREIVDVHEVDATVLGLDDLDGHLPETDVLVTATGARTPVVETDMLAGADQVYCMDLGQPRDIAPNADDLPNVTVRNLDDLEEVTQQTRSQRAAAAEAVREIIDEEFDRLIEQFKRKRADEVIGAMYDSADRIKSREMEMALSKLEARGSLTDEQREVIDAFADSLVSQLLAAPTRALRDAAAEDDWSTIATAIRLFDPEFDGEQSLHTELISEFATEDSPARSTTGESDD